MIRFKLLSLMLTLKRSNMCHLLRCCNPYVVHCQICAIMARKAADRCLEFVECTLSEELRCLRTHSWQGWSGLLRQFRFTTSSGVYIHTTLIKACKSLFRQLLFFQCPVLVGALDFFQLSYWKETVSWWWVTTSCPGLRAGSCMVGQTPEHMRVVD